MSETATYPDDGVRAGAALRAWFEVLARERLTTVLAVLVACTWWIEGARDLLGASHRVVVFVDVAEALVCLWIAARLLVRRAFPGVPLVVVAYLCWVGLGLATNAPAAAVITAAKALLLLPVLAFLVAATGTSERRARTLAAVFLAMSAFEFVLTLGQSIGTTDPDSVVGTFGPSANAVTAAVVLVTTCVAVGAFLTGARYGFAALVAGAVLPIFSAWAVVKFVPVVLPVVAVVLALGALLGRQTTPRRAVVAVVALVASSGVVIGMYRWIHPDSFRALTNATLRDNYLRTAAITGSLTARIGAVAMSDYANAWVSTVAQRSGGDLFKFGNVASGDYTVWVSGLGAPWRHVRAGRPYAFSVAVESESMPAPRISVQIEWRNAANGLLATTIGNWRQAPGPHGRYLRLAIWGAAPHGTATAMPKIAVTSNSGAASSILTTVPRLVAGRSAPATPGGGAGILSPLPAAALPAAPRPVPGRLTQWRMAEHAISGSLATKLFGKGLGTATVAEELGVTPGGLSVDADAASHSDFGTLLVERGWIGIGVVGLLAAALAAAAIRIARAVPRGRWTTAFTLAVPGAVAVMAAYGMIAEQLRSRPAALTFWLVVALGLSPGAFLGRAPSRAGGDGSA